MNLRHTSSSQILKKRVPKVPGCVPVLVLYCPIVIRNAISMVFAITTSLRITPNISLRYMEPCKLEISCWNCTTSFLKSSLCCPDPRKRTESQDQSLIVSTCLRNTCSEKLWDTQIHQKATENRCGHQWNDVVQYGHYHKGTFRYFVLVDCKDTIGFTRRISRISQRMVEIDDCVA